MLMESSGCYQSDTGCVYMHLCGVGMILVRVARDLMELIPYRVILSVFDSENTSKM